MLLNVALFVVGVAWLQQQAELPSVLWLYPFAALVLAWSLAPAARARRPLFLRRAGSASLWFAGGFLWAALVAHVKLADYLPPEWEGRDVKVRGVIADLPEVTDRGARFEFDVEQVSTPLARVPRHITVFWYAEGEVPRRHLFMPASAGSSACACAARTAWPIPMASISRHGCSSAASVPRGTCVPSHPTAVCSRWCGAPLMYSSVSANGCATASSPRCRASRAQAFSWRWQGRPAGDLPRRMDSVYPGPGVNHLMSISGLHITMVSGLAFAIVLWSWRRFPALVARLAAVKAAAIAGLLVACGYALLAGFAVPAQRTVYMLAAVAAGLLLGLASEPLAVLALALLAATVVDPMCVLAPGFWLSFGAVALIMYVTAGRIGQPAWFVNWARVQWAVTIGLTPILLAMFQQVSVVSPLANAVAIPR